MREMLFQGKRIDNGEWIEGYLVITKDEYIIIPTAAERWGGGEFNNFALVDPSTVGQYTGLTDNTKWEQLTKEEQSDWLKNHTVEEWNGKKIFEGDIVKIDGYKKGYEVKYMLGQFFVGINMPIAYKRFDCEVIGNIHDNPELLKGAENEL